MQTSTSSSETGVGATRNSLETKEGLIWLEDITKSLGGREIGNCQPLRGIAQWEE